jgi:molybdenum cofactor cytidylyltransferase
MIHAMVLAAGESRRMGMPKPLLQFGSTTFLGQIVSVLQRSEVDGVTVVLGAQAARIRASTDLGGVDVVVNEDYRKGQLSSLTAGLKSLPSQAEALLLCLVDNPLITGATVNRVVRAFHETGKPIVIPVFEGRRGHPALFAGAMFDELLHAPADEGARYVVRSHKDHVCEVDIPEPAILARIDTPEDYLSHFGIAPRIIER